MTPKAIWKNEEGAIEGLPLQLLIMVVIAGVAIGVIVGWMSFSKTEVGTITANPDTITVSRVYGVLNTSVTITVLDQNGKALNDATVTLSGSGVDTAKKTGSNGTATFAITATLPTNTNTGSITATASYDSTWGKTTRTVTILVVRSST